jgi:hypothetical protein
VVRPQTKSLRKLWLSRAFADHCTIAVEVVRFIGNCLAAFRPTVPVLDNRWRIDYYRDGAAHRRLSVVVRPP